MKNLKHTIRRLENNAEAFNNFWFGRDPIAVELNRTAVLCEFLTEEEPKTGPNTILICGNGLHIDIILPDFIKTKHNIRSQKLS